MRDMPHVVPHDFWYMPHVANDLAQLDLPGTLDKIVRELGWNQQELASVLGYSRPTLNKIIRGNRILRVDEVKLIVGLLGIPTELIGLSVSGERVSPTDRRQVIQGAAGLAVSAALPNAEQKRPSAEDIKAVTRRYAALERERGGNALCSPLTAHVSRLAPLVRLDGRPPVVAAFGELCGLAGYAFYDAQSFRRADHYYSLALQAGYEANDSSLTGQVRALMSMRATWVERPNEGASHCEAALDTLSNLPARERAMLLGRQARAVALRGEPENQRVRTLIKQSNEIVEASNDADSILAYWSRSEIEGNAGIAYKDIGELALAEHHLRRAVDAAIGQDSRDATLYLGMLSRVLLKQGKAREGAATVKRILDTPGIVSTRSEKQLRLFMSKTTDKDAPAVRQVRTLIRSRLRRLA